MQLAIPDVASFPLNEMPTAWLYHPFLSGPLLADPPVTFGAVASRLTVTERDDVELLSYVSVQVLVVPAVSLEIVVVPHSADDCVTPAGSQLKATVTFTLYHPEEHAPPLQVTFSGAAFAVAAGSTRTASEARDAAKMALRPTNFAPQ